MEGRGAGVLVPEALGPTTSSDKQTPSPAITLEVPLQFAETQDPARKTWVELEHAKQLPAPGPEQLEQLESQVWHDEEVLSKY
jgi:hypothetical protein